MQPAFFRLAKSRLKPRDSLFLMNVIVADDDDPHARQSGADPAPAMWRRVRLLDTDGWVDRNAVIAAGAVTKLKKPRVLMPPKPGAAKMGRQLAILNWRRHKMMLKKRSFSLSGHRTSVALEARILGGDRRRRARRDGKAWRRWWPRLTQPGASGRWPAR